MNESIVNWSALGHALAAVAGATPLDSASRLSRFSRLVDGISAPLRVLERIDRLAARAEEGDVHAERELVDVLHFAADIAAVSDRHRPSIEPSGSSCGCGCSGGSNTDRASAAAAPGAYRDDDQWRDDHVIGQRALTELLVSISNVAGRVGHDVGLAMDTVVALAADSTLAVQLATGYRKRGVEGAIGALVDARHAGRLGWIDTVALGGEPPVMNTMGGVGPAMPNLPGLPNLPGNIGGIGWPGGPGVPGVPGVHDPTLNDLIAGLLDRHRKPKRWDPDDWCPVYPWNPLEQNYIDPATTRWIACVIESRRILNLMASPPAPPATPVVWTTGITSVTLGGQCGGDTVTINGNGFGATQPANTVLLLPTLDGCRPVTPTSWSSTKITALLPATVASGPVGFGDAAYIAAYDAWAMQMAELAKQLDALFCAPRRRPDIRPFHQCPPASPIVSITAGVAVIDSFTANGDTTLVHESGDPITLAWTARNCSAVTVARTSAQGPLFGGSASYGTAAIAGDYAFGPVTHTGPAVWTYTITASGACGGMVSRSITVVTTRPLNLKVVGIQVTQSIQTATHSVEMVAFKPTVVRVLLGHGLAGWGGNQVPNVSGRIRMFRNGAWSGWIDPAPAVAPMVATPGTSITVVANPSFNVTTDSLNFMLPAGWCWGSPTFQVEVRVNGFGAIGGFVGQSQTLSRNCPSVTFNSRRMLQFRYVRVNWNGAGAPTDAVCVNTLRGAVPLLPTPTAGVAALAGHGVENRTSGMSANAIATERRNMLDDFDDEHNCSTWEAMWEWLGADCPDEDGTIWVLIPGSFQVGEAYDIPSNVCYTPPSDGPYAAHEISHCLNQQHVRLPATGSNAPSGGDAASAWPNNGMQVDVPFDTVGTSGATQPRALSLAGTGVADVMTYWGTQNNTWPLPARWTRLWNEIGP